MAPGCGSSTAPRSRSHSPAERPPPLNPACRQLGRARARASATARAALDAGRVKARLVEQEIRLARQEPTVRIRSARVKYPSEGEEIVVCCMRAGYGCKKG